MDNDIIKNKNWLQRNLKWLLPVVIVVCFLGSALFSTASDAHLGGYAMALNDEALYKDALTQAQQNKEVVKVLGTLESIDQLAIIESNVEYSDSNKHVNLSVRIKGSKAKGKMDVIATKANNTWQYNAITIRIKDPKQEIVVLQ